MDDMEELSQEDEAAAAAFGAAIMLVLFIGVVLFVRWVIGV